MVLPWAQGVCPSFTGEGGADRGDEKLLLVFGKCTLWCVLDKGNVLRKENSKSKEQVVHEALESASKIPHTSL